MILTGYEFISLVHLRATQKTSVWSCRNKKSGDELGEIKWYGPWRQYCYFPTVQAVYSAGCLRDISEFLDRAKAAHIGATASEGSEEGA